MYRAIFIILTPILLTSCALIGDEPWAEIDPGDITIETDQTSYTAHQDPEAELETYQFTIVSQFDNNSGRTLYLATCTPSSIQPNFDFKLINEESSSISAYSGFDNCSGRADPIMIHSGQGRIDTLEISGPSSWENGSNAPIGALEGSFRLVYEALTCPAGDRCEIPDSLAWSNEFEVHIAD